MPPFPSLRESLARRVLAFIQEHHLLPSGEKVVVGVSGGPDSLCLLHLLLELREPLGISLHVAHLNHRLRGEESEADARFVADLAQRLGLDATVEARDVLAYKKEHRLSVEEAAREVRYAFLAEVARSTGAGRVAVGHTARDQAETVLMHLVRGTGLAGLRGIRPLAQWRSPNAQGTLIVVRPLLEVGREETEACCAALGLEPRLETERWPSLRHRLRSQLMPLLRSYNPQVEKALLRLAREAAQELDFWEGQVREHWDEVVTEEGAGLSFRIQALSTLSPALQRHLLRHALERLRGDLRDIEAVHIEKMREAAVKPAGGVLSPSKERKLSLPDGLVMVTQYEAFFLGPAGSLPLPLPPLEGAHPLKVPGETMLPGWRVKATLGAPTPGGPRGEGWKADLDAAVAGASVVVRPRRPGDLFHPLGMEQPKKLQDFMVDAKISRAWRDRVPLVCSPQHILWVAGWRIDHRARVTDATREVLTLEFQKVS
ncbi:MAG: tRNA lysidine(34) synthetase TilS [Chloroflexota bacterium]|nr:tRNA lysidine(34) synthetase TilS [Chloroflexota bacterium]